MTMNIVELIDDFEDNILFDATGTQLKVARSAAAHSLIDIAERGTLKVLAAHLRENVLHLEYDLPTAWGMLLSDIGLKLGIRTYPAEWDDLSSWISWAEYYASSTAPTAA